ncbi:hypothetical protein ACFOOK_28255 [Micromonospora krabiensis]|uniref:Uncharacterized protein n=1 Tax=Micromonospora krabiensis TaxID=307121 RepID=A0A1C3N4N2_9ACTN|nr:hypothetical protein [Micromonospora krabiensis]SBV27537.1 hypothetical protein GA0070620_3061 [Micromonospora krabiensis]
MIANLIDRILGRTDTHPGADNDWADLLAGLTEDTRRPGRHRTNDDTTQVLRRPIAAITATAEYEVDLLGPWQPWQHELEPAHIWRQMTEVPR